MRIGERDFSPAWWSFAVTFATVALFVALGMWQLDRAAYKQSIQDKFEQRLAQDYQVFNPDHDLDDIEYRKILVRGRYDNAQHFLLDNQVYQGRVGYHVLTPFYLEGSGSVILVNRGWVAGGESRLQLPPILPAPPVELIAGIARFPTEPALQLGVVELSGNWPQVIPRVDMALLRENYAAGLLPMVLWLAPEQTDAYVRDWNPIWLPPEKSRAYAVQWFTFALVVLGLFFILNLRKIE